MACQKDQGFFFCFMPNLGIKRNDFYKTEEYLFLFKCKIQHSLSYWNIAQTSKLCIAGILSVSEESLQV